MVLHRLTRWLFVFLVALLALPAQLLAQQATPASGDTQLYIGHSARLTARIPTELGVEPTLGLAYGDGEVLFTTATFPQPTLMEACEAGTAELAADDAYTISETTFDDAPACRVDIPSTILGVSLTVMILTHPEPFDSMGMTVSYVGVVSTPDIIDTILPTISFDISGLTGPEIAHSLLDIIESESYFGNEIDWQVLRDSADAIQSPDDVDIFLANHVIPALRSAGDKHSFLMPPVPVGGGENMFPGPPSGEMRGSLGYIEITSGALPDDWDDYVSAGVNTVAELEPHACGWIVDLRSNVGGSVPIMVEPLLPFLPEAPLFGFVDRHGTESWVSRRGDRLIMETNGVAVRYSSGVDTPLTKVRNPDAPIAVLVGPQTMSAGEYTLLSLSSRPNTRSFGQPTGGYTTGNGTLGLLDGSSLALAGTAAIDVDGNVHTGKLQPDEWIASQSRGGGAQGNDGTIIAAEQWLLSQPACQDVATPVMVATPVD